MTSTKTFVPLSCQRCGRELSLDYGPLLGDAKGWMRVLTCPQCRRPQLVALTALPADTETTRSRWA